MGNPDRQAGALRTAMERTDQLIEQAREAVRASQAPVAKLNLEAAVDLQGKAWRAFDNDYPRLAQRLTGQARDRARQAIAAGRLVEQGDQVVQSKLDRVADLLERTRPLLADHGDGSYQAVFQSASDNYDQAWEFYRSQRFRAAVMLANQAETALKKLLRAFEGDLRGNLSYERRAEAVQRLLERARSMTAGCGSENGSTIVDQAEQAFQQGRELADSGRPHAALRALQQAKKLADQAIHNCNGDESLVKRLERLRHQTRQLAETVSPSDDQGLKYLETARDQLRLAEEAIGDGHEQSAAAALKAAELTLSQLKRYLDAAGR